MLLLRIRRDCFCNMRVRMRKTNKTFSSELVHDVQFGKQIHGGICAVRSEGIFICRERVFRTNRTFGSELLIEEMLKLVY